MTVETLPKLPGVAAAQAFPKYGHVKNRAPWQNKEPGEVHMKKSRLTGPQIVAVLKKGETGVPVNKVCRKHGISDATDYNWKSKCKEEWEYPTSGT